MAMDVEDYDWFGAMLEYFGPEKGRRLMQGHRQAGAKLAKGPLVAGAAGCRR